jgi:protein subunit release factor A
MSTFPREYRIPESDGALLDECDVTTFVASGPGGQHRNRNRTAIRLQHGPSGIVVIGRRERSLARNRSDALDRLRERLGERMKRPKLRRATRPTPASRRKRTDAKRRKSAVKKLRGRVGRDD